MNSHQTPGPSRPIVDADYQVTRTFTAEVNWQGVTVVSKPGFRHWDVITPATKLLAEATAPSSGRLVVVGCGHGALGVAVARLASQGHVILMDPSVVALAMADRTLKANGITNAEVAAEGTLTLARAGPAEMVVVECPRDRALARSWLVAAHNALATGGTLLLAGGNNQGIKSIISDAGALFGTVTLLTTKTRHRVARCLKTDPPPAPPVWATEPGIALGTWRQQHVTMRGIQFHLWTLPGVFAHDRLDAGTHLLLEHLQVPTGATVLDVGCGSGIIGLTATRLGANHVDLIDADLGAVASSRESIARNGIDRATAFESDALDAVRDRRYDLVLTNPPFHQGRAVDTSVAAAFIEQAHHVLRPGGRLLLVANRFLPYDTLLRATFGHCELVAESAGYRLMAAMRGG